MVIFKTFIIFLMASFLSANNPNVLTNQEFKKSDFYTKPYNKITSSYVHYVYGSSGAKIVSVNYNKFGKLISKTTYSASKKRQVFIYNDDCESIDCYQFIH